MLKKQGFAGPATRRRSLPIGGRATRNRRLLLFIGKTLRPATARITLKIQHFRASAHRKDIAKMTVILVDREMAD